MKPLAELLAELPPRPWTWATSGAPGGSGHYNLYVSDRSGRKICGVYGKRGEQEKIAEAICRIPEMLAALNSGERQP